MKSWIREHCFRFGITGKLALTFALLTTGVVLLLALGAYQLGKAILIDAEIDTLKTSSLEKEEAIDSWLVERKRIVRDIANSDIIRRAILLSHNLSEGNDRPARGAGYLHRQLAMQTRPAGPFDAIMLLEPNSGRVLLSTDPAETGTFKENRDYFLVGREKLFVQQPYYSLPRGAPSMVISAPISGATATPLAVVAARLDLGELNTIVQRRPNMHQTDESYLVNRSRLFVTQPRLLTDRAAMQRGIRGPHIDSCIAGQSGHMVTENYRHAEVISVYRWLPMRQLCLITEMNLEEAFHPIGRFATGLVWGAAGIMLGVALLGGFLAINIARPILALQTGVASVARGHYGQSLEVPSKDEIGVLVKGFNTMSDALAEKDAEISAYSRELEERVKRRTAELRAAQAELVKQEKLATLGQLTATVSHELRNPLGAIGTSVYSASRVFAGGDEKGLRALERISRSVARCDRIIDELLDFTRMRAPELTETQLGAWLAEIVQEIGKPDRVEFSLDIPEDDARVMIDPETLRRAVINLVDNAIQAADTAECEAPRVAIALEPGVSEVAIRISDNGPGIDEELMKRIFEPLFSTKSFGVGLGLAIVHQIALQHDGRVTVDSTPGKGSTFSLFIPRTDMGQSA